MAFRVGTVEGFHIVQAADLRLSAADRADLRDIPDTASCEVIRDLRDDHVRLVDCDPIPGPKLQTFHDADVVDAGPAHRRSFQLHGLKHGNRVDESCSRRAPLDIGERRLLDLIGPLEGDGISREFRSAPQGLTVGDIVI